MIDRDYQKEELVKKYGVLPKKYASYSKSKNDENDSKLPEVKDTKTVSQRPKVSDEGTLLSEKLKSALQEREILLANQKEQIDGQSDIFPDCKLEIDLSDCRSEEKVCLENIEEECDF